MKHARGSSSFHWPGNEGIATEIPIRLALPQNISSSDFMHFLESDVWVEVCCTTLWLRMVEATKEGRP